MATTMTPSGNSTTPSAVNATWSGGASDADYYFVWIYVSPCVLLIGVVGNVLTLLVMARRRMRGSSTCVYLSAIAVADTLALLCRIPPEFFEAARLFTFKELSRSLLQHFSTRIPARCSSCNSKKHCSIVFVDIFARY